MEHADAFAHAEPQVPVYTVTALNREVRRLLEAGFAAIWVEGEISNFHHHRSGHMYFTLKDATGQLEAAMFRQANRQLDFTPEDGLCVRALGQLTVYEPRGRYQLVVEALRPAGAGPLQQAFERLKARLQAEGLFDPARKRPLPPFPARVGVVTAPGAAALRDVLSVLARRWPLEVFLFPTAVQGEGAAAQIAQALARADRFSREHTPLDALLLIRGGGSLEDLWAFNEELTARAIATCRLPVVSGVGHEVDFTIADFVADVRAPTPSAAAELLVPDRDEVLAQVRAQVRQAARLSQARLSQARARLEGLRRSHGLRRPAGRLREAFQRLDDLSETLCRTATSRLERLGRRAELLTARLRGLDPHAPLRRGYALVRDEAGRLVRAGEQVRPGDRLTVRLQRGALTVRVEEVTP